MLGLRNVAAMQVEEPAGADATAAARDRPAWIGRTLVDADGQRWYELDLAALAASPAFLMVGR